MKLLLIGQVMVDGEAPICLANGQNTYMGESIIKQSWKTGGRDEFEKACGSGAEARSGNLVSGPLLPRCGSRAAGGSDKTLGNKNWNLDTLPVYVAAKIASRFCRSWHGVGTLVLNVLTEPIGAKVKKRFVSPAVQFGYPHRTTERETKIVLMKRRRRAFLR